MQLARVLSGLALFLAVLSAQQPIGIGPDSSAGLLQVPGLVKFLDWYNQTGQGHAPQGDFYYFSAWLPNATGLPVTSGLPIVGTLNDYTISGCSGNVAMIQLDTFNWATPSAAHVTKINCMISFNQEAGAHGWYWHLTSGGIDNGHSGSWKSRVPFSKAGKLYLPVERQIHAGGSLPHDATMIVSPDSGAHWCNPFTYANRAGGPGCDATNWQADGDAPKCGGSGDAAGVPCTDPGYLDAAHSSMMWKLVNNDATGRDTGAENWAWINFGNQDGQPFPTGGGADSGCDPAVHTCFMLLPGDGAIARVPNASIMDISAWQYYTCPTITQNNRCPGTDPNSWTSNFANRTSVVQLAFAGSAFNGPIISPYTVMYLKDFKMYLMTGQQTDFAMAPTLQGPWTMVHRYWPYRPLSAQISPALGYKTLSSDPPHVQLSETGNNYLGGEGSPEIALWDLVAGKHLSGEAFQFTPLYPQSQQGAGYQFSSGNVAGSFPRRGLVWSFDLQDASGATNWPSFMDRGNYSAVITPCDGPYTVNRFCGLIQNTHGTALWSNGITTITGEYPGHFRVAVADFQLARDAPTPTAMQANGSYSVIGVYRLDGITALNRPGAIWTTGSPTGGDNSMVELDQSNGTLALSWGSVGLPHYQYPSSWTFTQGNWYFVAATVRAALGCGSNCVPAASIWVGGATAPGVLSDVLAGSAYTSAGAATKTPAVVSGPFVLGMSNTNGDARSSVSYASLMVYDRALSYPELQSMYKSMRAKMTTRGVQLQ